MILKVGHTGSESNGTVAVKGWAFDTDKITESIDIHESEPTQTGTVVTYLTETGRVIRKKCKKRLPGFKRLYKKDKIELCSYRKRNERG